MNIPDNLNDLTPEEISLWLNTAKAEVRERENDVATQKRLVAILKELAAGPIQKRFLTALRNVPEYLYRQIYPRRYLLRPGYWEPKYSMLISAWHHFSTLALELREKEGWDIRKLVAEGVPTYYLSAKAMDALEETDAADVLLSCDDFDWPHEAFQVVMPKRGRDGEPVVIVFARNDKWARFSWVASNEANGKSCLGDVEIPRALSISKGLALDTEAHFHPAGNIKIGSLAINILLAMVAEPDFNRCRGHKHSKPDVQGIQHYDLNAAWTPNVLDFCATAIADSHVTGYLPKGSKRAHARRGHYRTRWIMDVEKWTCAADSVEAAPVAGKRAIWLGDQRLAVRVVSIEGLAAVVEHHTGRKEIPITELRPAKAKITWVRKALIGLNSHISASPTTP